MKDTVPSKEEESRLSVALAAQKPIMGAGKSPLSHGPRKPIHVGNFGPKGPNLPTVFPASLPGLADQWAG